MIMIGILFLLAFFLMAAIVFLIFAGAIKFYVNHNHNITAELVFRLVIALCGHIVTSVFILFVFEMLLFVQAHSRGEILLSWKEKLFHAALLIIYVIVGWLLASLASGKLITFRSVWERSKIESIRS
jgi:hypothetical protein